MIICYILKKYKFYKALKQRLLMELDVEKLRAYFSRYNEQVKEVPGIIGLYEVDVSRGLDRIAESVYDSKRLREQSFLNNNWTCRARNQFCEQVLLYFLKTGEVPDYNAREIINNSKERLPFPIGKSFEKFSKQLMLLRGIEEQDCSDEDSGSCE